MRSESTNWAKVQVRALPRVPAGWFLAKSSGWKPLRAIRAIAKASPSASCREVLVVGAKSNGHASSSTATSSTTSAALPRGESGRAVIATMRQPRLVNVGSNWITSSLPPLFDRHRMTSWASTAPTSPCKASPACRNNDRVPVELRVAAILAAMCALLPTPVTTTFPFASTKMSRASSKESSSAEAAP